MWPIGQKCVVLSTAV